MLTFQAMILRLQAYWDQQGCALLQPYDMEVGAGTFHTATFLRSIGPEPWRAAYVQPSRRPKDGRYGDNPNRLQHYYQFQVVLKPSPPEILELYLGSLRAIGIDTTRHDVRFVEDDWESPTLGAWGLGWEVWLNGMEVTQFTYFQEVGSLRCAPVTGEITYGLERLAMYLQGVESVYDLVWTPGISYRDVFHQNEVEQSTYNFELADVPMLFRHFSEFETQAKRLIEARLPLPAYEMVMKCSHCFNLLDARGAISVTERAGTIGRVRQLARGVAQAYHDARQALGFPMARRAGLLAAGYPLEWVDSVRPATPGEVEPALPAPARAVAAKATPPTEPGTQPLLVELFTEELPPRALGRLRDAFCSTLRRALLTDGLITDSTGMQAWCTPRRLALRLDAVASQAPARTVVLKGPSTAVGLDTAGQPTLALRKWAEKQGVSLDTLERTGSGKQEHFRAVRTEAGALLADRITPAIQAALASLPVPRMMNYQQSDGLTTVQFVRPAHSLLVLHGDAVVPCSVLGLESGRTTRGHRFQGPAEPMIVERATDYEQQLQNPGRVLVSFEARRERIAEQLEAAAAQCGAQLVPPPAAGSASDAEQAVVTSLLDEVTALVEWPAVYVGQFDESFLAVPQECLILTMRTNQKYFPLFDASGHLLPRFLIVSNMDVDDPTAIIDGNERVVRPRLADARFFFETDLRTRLVDRLPGLDHVVYHARLGTQGQRTARVVDLAGRIARRVAADGVAVDPLQVERAARLAKADLLTGMVGEFPELQGQMGRTYALADGEDPAVAEAIAEHYRPRFASDQLPQTAAGRVLALADKLETLTGIWGIGSRPTGDRDPFALRRAALGLCRILVETGWAVNLVDLLDDAAATFAGLLPTDAAAEPSPTDISSAAKPRAEPVWQADVPGIHAFCLDRLRSLLTERAEGASAPSVQDIEAVLAVDDRHLDRVPARLAALSAFRQLPEFDALAAANKRVANLLRRSASADATDPQPTASTAIDPSHLVEPAEQALYASIARVAPTVEQALAAGRFTEALTALVALRDPVDAFFSDVMVNADDPVLRANRHALLAELSRLMNGVADLSRL